MVDVARCEPRVFAAKTRNSKSLVRLGDHRNLVVFALLFRKRFPKVEGDLARAAFELFIASVRFAEQHENRAFVTSDLRNALIARRKKHQEFWSFTFRSRRDGHVFCEHPTGFG